MVDNPFGGNEPEPPKTAATAAAIAGAAVGFRGTYGGSRGAAATKYREMLAEQAAAKEAATESASTRARQSSLDATAAATAAAQNASRRAGYTAIKDLGDSTTQREASKYSDADKYQATGEILESQRQQAVASGDNRAARFYENELSKWAQNSVEESSAYHRSALASGVPTGVNPYENRGDAALMFLKAGGKDDRNYKFNPDAMGLIGKLPAGQGVQERAWSEAVRRDRNQPAGAPVSYMPAVQYLGALGGRQGVYGNLAGGKPDTGAVLPRSVTGVEVTGVGMMKKPFLSTAGATTVEQPRGDIFGVNVPLISPMVAMFQSPTITTRTTDTKTRPASTYRSGEAFWSRKFMTDKGASDTWAYPVGAPVVTSALNPDTGETIITTSQPMESITFLPMQETVTRENTTVTQGKSAFDIFQGDISDRIYSGVGSVFGKSGGEVKTFIGKQTQLAELNANIRRDQSSIGMAFGMGAVKDTFDKPVEGAVVLGISYVTGGGFKLVEGVGAKAAPTVIKSSPRLAKVAQTAWGALPWGMGAVYTGVTAQSVTDNFTNIQPGSVAVKTGGKFSTEIVPMTVGFYGGYKTPEAVLGKKVDVGYYGIDTTQVGSGGMFKTGRQGIDPMEIATGRYTPAPETFVKTGTIREGGLLGQGGAVPRARGTIREMMTPAPDTGVQRVPKFNNEEGSMAIPFGSAGTRPSTGIKTLDKMSGFGSPTGGRVRVSQQYDFFPTPEAKLDFIPTRATAAPAPAKAASPVDNLFTVPVDMGISNVPATRAAAQTAAPMSYSLMGAAEPMTMGLMESGTGAEASRTTIKQDSDVAAYLAGLGGVIPTPPPSTIKDTYYAPPVVKPKGFAQDADIVSYLGGLGGVIPTPPKSTIDDSGYVPPVVQTRDMQDSDVAAYLRAYSAKNPPASPMITPTITTSAAPTPLDLSRVNMGQIVPAGMTMFFLGNLGNGKALFTTDPQQAAASGRVVKYTPMKFQQGYMQGSTVVLPSGNYLSRFGTPSTIGEVPQFSGLISDMNAQRTPSGEMSLMGESGFGEMDFGQIGFGELSDVPAPTELRTGLMPSEYTKKKTFSPMGIISPTEEMTFIGISAAGTSAKARAKAKPQTMTIARAMTQSRGKTDTIGAIRARFAADTLGLPRPRTKTESLSTPMSITLGTSITRPTTAARAKTESRSESGAIPQAWARAMAGSASRAATSSSIGRGSGFGGGVGTPIPIFGLGGSGVGGVEAIGFKGIRGFREHSPTWTPAEMGKSLFTGRLYPAPARAPARMGMNLNFSALAFGSGKKKGRR